MTLEELKRKNAEAEAARLDTAQSNTADSEDVPAEDEEPLEPESATGEEGETEDAQEIPTWMQSEDQTSQDGDHVPVKAHVSMRKKLKARAKEAESEVETLRQEIEKLKTGTVTAAPQTNAPVKRPKLEDYDYDEDKYNNAIDDWMESKLSAKLNSFEEESQQARQQRLQKESLEKSVNDHYERAAKLVEDGLLTAEEYHNSDAVVRRRLDAIAPGKGDAVTDNILAVLGEGSEKVIVALSRNPTYMMELENRLQSDATGSKALVYLGSLTNQFNQASGRRSTNAPKPVKRVNGDASAPSSGERSSKKAYEAAHKSGDRQKAFDIKRKAKADGINVREW